MEERIYFKLEEVANICGVKSNTIKNWEKHFVRIRPRVINGRNFYKREVLDIIKKIKIYLQEENKTIDETKELIKKCNNLNDAELFAVDNKSDNKEQKYKPQKELISNNGNSDCELILIDDLPDDSPSKDLHHNSNKETSNFTNQILSEQISSTNNQSIQKREIIFKIKNDIQICLNLLNENL